MKKLLLAMVMVGLVSWFPMSAVGEDEVIYGCYKKNGRLRIVDNPSACRPSEVAISFNELDADLVPGNIRSGVSIFGVSGDPDVVDTSSGDAGAAEILSGKKAWVDGMELTGSMPNKGAMNFTPGSSAQVIPQGYHNGFGTDT